MPVPDGLVLTPDFLTRFAADFRRRRATASSTGSGSGSAACKLAVRSSGAARTAPTTASPACSSRCIDVDRDGLEAAIAKVQELVRGGARVELRLSAGAGNVLIQRMVDAEYSGVLFTRDPSAGGLAMIEMVQRHRGEPGVRQRAPADLPVRPRHQEAVRRQRMRRSILVRCSRWATRPSVCSAGRRTSNGPIATAASIWCRAATSPGRSPAMPTRPRCRTTSPARSNSPRARSPTRSCSARTSSSEMLPRPTPLSLSLMEALWAAGGSVDLAARELGLTYRVDEGSTYLVTILGRLYVDKREEQAPRARRRPAGHAAAAAQRRSDRARFPRASSCRGSSTRSGCQRGRFREAVDGRTGRGDQTAARPLRLRHPCGGGRGQHRGRHSISTAPARCCSADAIDPSSLLGHIPETIRAPCHRRDRGTSGQEPALAAAEELRPSRRARL